MGLHRWTTPPPARALLEVVYRFDLDDGAWVDELAAVASRALGGCIVASALTRIDLDGFRIVAGFPRVPEAVQQGSRELGVVVRRLPAFDSWRSSEPGRAALLDAYGPHLLKAIGGVGDGPVDGMLCVGTNPDGTQASIGCVVPMHIDEIDPAVAPLWKQLSAHFAAAARLRLLHKNQKNALATLTPGGKVVDAAPAASDAATRADLVSAVRAIDAARTGKVTDPEALFRAWRALVSRRFSLIDQFDADGRRFVIAVDNAPRSSPGATLQVLSPRERQVVSLAALGQGNKQIGYALDLSTSTVATYLRSASVKLGTPTRVALVREVARAVDQSLLQAPPLETPSAPEAADRPA